MVILGIGGVYLIESSLVYTLPICHLTQKKQETNESGPFSAQKAPNEELSIKSELSRSLSDIPGQSGSTAVLLGVFSQLPGSFLIGDSHFPDSGPEVLRSNLPGGPLSSSH